MSKSFAPKSGICVAELRMSSTGTTSIVLLSLHGFFRWSKMHLWSSMNCLMDDNFCCRATYSTVPETPKNGRGIRQGFFAKILFRLHAIGKSLANVCPKILGTSAAPFLRPKRNQSDQD